MTLASFATTAFPVRALGSNGDAGPGNVIKPDHEVDVLRLFHPYSPRDFRVAGWSIEHIVVGPECRIDISMQHEMHPGMVSVVLTPRADPEQEGTSSIAVTTGEDRTEGPSLDRLKTGLISHFRKNEGDDFFGDLCGLTTTVSLDDSPGRILLGWIFILLVIVCAVVASLLVRRARTALPRPNHPAFLSRSELFQAAVLSAVALPTRLYLMSVYSPARFELDDVLKFGVFRNLEELIFQLGVAADIIEYRAPLSTWLLHLWLNLLDWLGFGFNIVLFRLPNVFLTVFTVILLIRIGRIAGTRTVGIGAAFLFVFLPSTIRISVYWGNYFPEMVMTLWFVERLASYLIEGRSVHRSLAVTAALALWTGFMSALAVVPGLLTYALVSARRRRIRELLASFLLFAALTTPIIITVMDRAVGYSRLSNPTAERHDPNASRDHPSLPLVEKDIVAFATFPYRVMVGDVYGYRNHPDEPGMVATLVGLLGIAMFVVSRRLCSVYPVVVIILFSAADCLIYLRYQNLTVLWPFMLLMPMLGLDSVSRRVAGVRIGTFLLSLFVALSLYFVLAWPIRLLGESETGRTLPPTSHFRMNTYGHILGTSSFAHIAETIRDPGNRDSPLLVMDSSFSRYLCYLLCADDMGKSEFQSIPCHIKSKSLRRQDGFEELRLCGYRVIVSQLSNRFLPDFDSAALERLVSAWPEVNERHLVLAQGDDWDWIRFNHSDLLDSCVKKAAAPDLMLLECQDDNE